MTELLSPTSPAEVTSETLRELAELTGELVTTVVVHTERATSQPQQNAVRLKNATQDIERQLVDMGLDPPRVEAYRAPLDELQSDEVFWGHQLEALYVTLWEGGWRAFRLPYQPPERAVIDVRPHLQPLLPARADQGSFYVLALSQHHVRLLYASRTDVTEVDLTEGAIPRSVDDAAPDDDEQAPSLQHHPASSGSGRAIYHGHGGAGDYNRQLVDKFMRQLARGVDDLLAADQHAVVLAGVDTLCAQFRENSRLHTILDDNVSGNPDEARDEQLRDDAWPIVQPVLRQDLDTAIERFHASHGTGLALDDLPEILPAAEMGRVAWLLVRIGAERWGRFAPTEGLIADRAERAGPSDENLIEHAIALTAHRSGAAYALPAEEMPTDGDVAAVCRY